MMSTNSDHPRAETHLGSKSHRNLPAIARHPSSIMPIPFILCLGLLLTSLSSLENWPPSWQLRRISRSGRIGDTDGSW
jgi:hypothetical protein